MRIRTALRIGRRPHDGQAGTRAREALGRAAAQDLEPRAVVDSIAPTSPATRARATATSSATARSTAARLDELQAQARFARERYDLYKARTYGPRLTSPSRLQELERESERAQASLAFAKSEATRESD